MAREIRVRLADVVAKEYTKSLYLDVNYDSYYVWAAHNYWIIPWYDILAEQAAEEGQLGVAAGGGSDGGEEGGASRKW